MTKKAMDEIPNAKVDAVEGSRMRWLAASELASKMAAEMFQLGSGYGDPDARANDEQRLLSARHETERLFREYRDLERQDVESKLLRLQRSQTLATWASFAVAAVVGLATIASTLMALLR